MLKFQSRSILVLRAQQRIPGTVGIVVFKKKERVQLLVVRTFYPAGNTQRQRIVSRAVQFCAGKYRRENIGI
jgi:hypothetical protein